MLLKGYDRDFREVCATKWKFETGMAFGKTGKARALREQAQNAAKGGKESPSPYSGKPARPGGKGWGPRSSTSSAGSASTWTGAAVWAGSWWSADGHKVVVYKAGEIAVKREEIPSSIYFYLLQMLFLVVMTGFTIFILLYIFAKIRNCIKYIKGLLFPYRPFSVRSVGTQSQTTYAGDRFRAYENGFRRAGEVSIDLHETDPKIKQE
jgi:hypothetical protein